LPTVWGKISENRRGDFFLTHTVGVHAVLTHPKLEYV